MNNLLIPRPEYPRPQMVREEWMNLNGEWQFEMDCGMSGKERGLFESSCLSGSIIVPFCPESKLSGVGNKDFMPAVWYKREFTLPDHWRNQRILLHFGAVDYETEVWINGKAVGSHRGGYSSFSYEITDALGMGINQVTVCAKDDVRSGLQPGGKQSATYHSQGCSYTRTTGIWQTVWMECVPQSYVSSYKVVSDIENGHIQIDLDMAGKLENQSVQIEAYFDNKLVGCQTGVIKCSHTRLLVALSQIHLWEPGSPNLYDLKISLFAGNQCQDVIEGYFGLRSVYVSGKAIMINDKPVFQRLVLDQGFYPDGIYTAPTDDDLRKDIEMSLALGFNGARLHEKVFEPRFLYWADQLGYLVWEEHANWKLDITTAEGLEIFLPEWLEIMDRDMNHPSIIGWCPFNETWDVDGKKQNNEVLRIVYQVTKKLDPTRPVIDASGGIHVVTDIFDVHDYDQNPVTLSARYDALNHGGEVYVMFPERERYGGQPYFVSEYGGIWWNPSQREEASAWGYGERPRNEAEFLERYIGLTTVLLNNRSICAFCYTQLYDVEQEVNGFYAYDRTPKFDSVTMLRIKSVNESLAAIEKEWAI